MPIKGIALGILRRCQVGSCKALRQGFPEGHLQKAWGMAWNWKEPGNEGTNNKGQRQQHDKDVPKMTYVASKKKGFVQDVQTSNPCKPGSNRCNWQPQTLPEVYSCKAMMGLINTITAATIQSLKCEVIQSRYARLLHACCTLNVKLFGGPSRHATIIYEILPMRTHMYQMMNLEARRGP